MADGSGGTGDLADQVERARVLYDLGRSAEAQQRLRAVLAVEPGHFDAGNLLAWGLLQDGLAAESLAVARQLIAAQPGSEEGWLRAAPALRLLRRPEEATEAARQAARIAPGDPAAHRLLAEALASHKEHHAEAEAAARQALALDPAPAGFATLASVLVSRRQWERAEQVMLQALRLAPQNAAYRMQLGLVRLQLRRFADAAADFSAALRLDPTPQYLATVADSWISNGRPAELAALYGLACAALGRPDVTKFDPADVSPDMLGLYVHLIWQAQESGELAGARALAERVLAVDPGHQLARAALAEVLKDAGEPTQAAGLCEGLMAEGYDPAGVWQTLVYARKALGQLDQARADCAAAARRHPDMPVLPLMLARLFLGARMPGDAVAAARQAVALDPGYRDAQHVLGVALNAAGEAAEAARVLEVAFDQYPDSIASGCMQALSLIQAGDPAGAEAAARHVISVHPDSPLGYRALALALRDRAGREEEYFRACERVVEHDPDDHEFLHKLAVIHVGQERWAQAQPLAARAHAGDPGNAGYHMISGLAAIMVGQLADGEAALRACLDAHPEPGRGATVASVLESLGVPPPLADLYQRSCAGAGRDPARAGGAQAARRRAEFAASLRALGAHEQAAEVEAAPSP